MANQTTTVPIQRLGQNYAPWTHVAHIKASDVNTSTWTTEGDTIDVEFSGKDLDNEFVVLRAVPYVHTAFAGSGSLLLEVGTDGDPNNFVTSTTIATAGPVVTQAGAVPATLAGSFGSAGDDLMARITTESATGAPSHITAGDMKIWFEIMNLTELNKGW